MRVLIVSRTRMGGDRRCIGAIAENDQPLRLLTRTGNSPDIRSPFQVGEIWDIEWRRVPGLRGPHVEDVAVIKREHVGEQEDLEDHLLGRVRTWSGSIRRVFEGHVRFTGNNSGYISAAGGIPDQSTGFWIPDRTLTLRSDGRHFDYRSRPLARGLAYVGEEQAPQRIAAGTLLRVSLARWWTPPGADPGAEERCYLQLSGWY